MENNFTKNVTVLTFLMLIKKLLSIVYKIPYQNVTGDAGFYVFQQIYPFIAISMVLTGFALPTVIGSLLTRHHYSAAIKDKLKRLMWLVSSFIFAIFILANRQIALTMGDVLLAPIIRVVGFHFLFIPPIAYLRGVLQSRSETIKDFGYSVVIEQLMRVFAVLMVISLFNISTYDYYKIAELAFLASLISPVTTVLHLYLLKPKDDIQSFLPLSQEIHFFRRTLYLLGGAGVLVIFNLIDSFLVFNTLVTRQTQHEAMVLVGVLERGLPIIQAGTFFVSSLVAMTMSKFESAMTDKQKKNIFGLGLFYILGLSIPATVGLIMVIPYLNMAFYMNQAGNETLQIMTAQILLYALVVLLTATLSREEKQPFVLTSLLLGFLIKIFLTVPLVNQYGINGAAVSSIFGLAIMSLMMLIGVKSLFTTKLIAIVIGISISTFVMWLCLRMVAPAIAFLNNGTRWTDLYLLLLNTIIGIVVYGLVMTLQIYLFNVMEKKILTRRQKKMEYVMRAKRKHERLEKEALKCEHYRQSLMHNKPKLSACKSQVFHQSTNMSKENKHEKKEGRKMRLDKFLKVSRIVKRRQTAKEVSDAGKISVNGKVAKSSTPLSVGDEIALHYTSRTLVVKVLEIKDSTKKEDAMRMYEIVSE